MESRSSMSSSAAARLAEIASANAGGAPDSDEVATATVDAFAPSSYPCPHCRVLLEFPSDDGWNGWRRCPACERPLLPPERFYTPEAPWLAPSPILAGLDPEKGLRGLSRISPPSNASQTTQPSGEWFEPYGEAWRSRRTRIYRRVLLGCLVLAGIATFVNFLEQNNLGLGFYSLVSLFVFFLLIRPQRRY